MPDNDLFASIKDGKASVVTDTIESFTETGLQLSSGQKLDADIIVSATGLVLEMAGGLNIRVDGRDVDFGKTVAYKGMMYAGVPNMASSFGYTNASWTLKCDLTCEYVCRLLNHMDRIGMRQATPSLRGAKMETESWWGDFSSGYVQRIPDKFPRQGKESPWRLHQNYARDLMDLKFGPVDDDAMQFSHPVETAKAPHGEPVGAMAE